MEAYIPVLSKCTLFKGIAGENLGALLSCLCSYTRSYKDNEYVFFAGNQINHIGILVSGSAEIIKENLAGNRHIMAFLDPAQIFGEGIVCTAQRISPVTIRVKEAAAILFIPYERIIKSCGNSCSFHVQLIQNMMMILGQKNYNLNNKIELLALKGMREKLAAYLLTESKSNNSLSFNITPNRNELAEYLNVSRTSMCRELAKMKEENILDYYQNSFKILSAEALKKCLM
ncbi:CRP-like cAMP-binding protein [Ruminiclostridium sufflavum DSM 19573]|uniref:CRP-like cAMP-binding protein n=1 Tax=Ruminiclostridium sufflavum DSM 19573 TaxID=1121337 RepID=A0A318XP74_9FIRM|nr:Crp/Fnr family transcriptional regulator [Ruminiclostridium sufflavum]PYG87858.1 CRP-like cAMP-binding protein [Ruminiclostridium sufflavum DSM 19573]